MSLYQLLRDENKSWCKVVANSIKFNNNSSSTQTELNYYEKMDLPVQYGGIYNVPLNRTLMAERIGDVVHLYFPNGLDISNGNQIMTISPDLPPQFIPFISSPANYNLYLQIGIDAGNLIVSALRIDNTGNMRFEFSGPTSGQAGILDSTLCYEAVPI